jgi:hypothetical protein
VIASLATAKPGAEITAEFERMLNYKEDADAA